MKDWENSKKLWKHSPAARVPTAFLILKEIKKNMVFVFLSSYRNTRESLGELEKAVETLACGSCSHSISRSPNFHSYFYNSTETRTCFLFLMVDQLTLQHFTELKNSVAKSRAGVSENLA